MEKKNKIIENNISTLIKKDYKQRHALQDIKDIFLDAFTLPPRNESKDIMEQLSDIVEQVTNET